MERLKILIEGFKQKIAVYFTVFQLKRYIKPYRLTIVILIFVNICAAIAGMVNPLLTQKLIDQVLPNKDWNLFYMIFGAYVGVYVLSLVLGTVISYIKTAITEKMSLAIKIDMQKACSKASYRFFERRRPGEHIFRFSSDVGTIVDIFTNQFPNILIILVQLVLFLVIAFGYSPRITLLYLSIIPFKVLMEILKSNRLRPLQKQQLEIGQDITNFFSEYRMGILTTKIFSREKFEEKRMVDVLAKGIRLVFKTWRTDTLYELVRTFFGGGWEAVVMFFGWSLVIKGELTIGVLVALQLYLGRLAGPINSSIHIIGVLVQGSIAAERIQETLRAEAEEAVPESGPVRPGPQGNIEFKEVCFGYLPGQTVINNVSFVIKPGMTIGITGPSGVGKTTIIHLLLRIYEQNTGIISIGGMDIRRVPVMNLRKYFSIVQQEIFLFNGTVRENILYGNRNAGRDDIVRAAQAAQAHEFVMNLSDGYDTMLGGKNGISLSTGQKQRIALARALVKDSPVLILDEFTSSLDAESESSVFDSIHKLYKDKLIVIVSHKVAHLLDTDWVVVIHKGTIAQNGRPKELIHQDGVFKKLYQLQFKISDLQFEREYKELEKELIV